MAAAARPAWGSPPVQDRVTISVATVVLYAATSVSSRRFVGVGR